ncbi:MAG: NADH-quinone oxidoreductase subunit B family protein, partial [Gammaproteobacteria bacterium]
MTAQAPKPRIAVHKFSSCDGCQLAFLNLGEDLLALNELVDIVHFAEAGMLDETAQVDIAFVEGSISTRADIERIQMIRKQSRYLITIGACATAGGLQALRNLSHAGWLQAVYPQPDY